MNKTELLSTYTAEQLAEMVVNLEYSLRINGEVISDLENKIHKLKEKYAEILWEHCDSVKKEDYDSEVNRLQSEVEKYRKAFEDVKNERECQIAEYQKKIEELTAERDFLEKENISIHQDPIDIAKDLINAEGEYEHNPLAKALCGEDKGTYRIFNIGELRQIAEHLIVYCNHHGEVEE